MKEVDTAERKNKPDTFAQSADVALLIRDRLNPYVAVGSALITILGIIGGWSGEYLLVAVGVFLAMGMASGILGSMWNKSDGTPPGLMLASAANGSPAP